MRRYSTRIRNFNIDDIGYLIHVPFKCYPALKHVIPVRIFYVYPDPSRCLKGDIYNYYVEPCDKSVKLHPSYNGFEIGQGLYKTKREAISALYLVSQGNRNSKILYRELVEYFCKDAE